MIYPFLLPKYKLSESAEIVLKFYILAIVYEDIFEELYFFE